VQSGNTLPRGESQLLEGLTRLDDDNLVVVLVVSNQKTSMLSCDKVAP
jgi:hypothetical protein